jgi:hypothetical protein
MSERGRREDNPALSSTPSGRPIALPGATSSPVAAAPVEKVQVSPYTKVVGTCLIAMLFLLASYGALRICQDWLTPLICGR